MKTDEQKQFIAYHEEKIFYNHPIAMADFNHLCKFNTFNVDQVVALSLGRNPDQVNLEKISRTSEMFDFVKEYKNRYALVSNYFAGLITLHEFIAWAVEQEISLPAELIEWFNRKNEVKKTNPNNKNLELHSRAETTYQNIVASLLDFIEGKIPDIEKHSSYVSDNKLFDAISKHYIGIAGLSQSTLAHKIPECRRSLENSSH